MDLSNWQSNQQLVCLVSKPDSVVIEVQVDRNGIGQDILDKVCESIGTVEKDYFGLQYATNKIDRLWLNLRNRVVSQVSSWQSPLRLRLRVKYFVEPHYLLQEVTRKLFYTQLKQNIFDGRLSVPAEQLSRALAAIAQAEIGDQHPHQHKLLDSYAGLFPFGEQEDAEEEERYDLQQVIHEHSQLCGTSKTAAVSQFLYTVSALRQYGMEPYSVKLDVAASTAQINNNNTTTTTQQGQQTDGRSSPSKQATLEEIKFCIGPRGLEIIDQSNTERKFVPFRAVQLANSFGKQIDLHVFQDDGSVRTIILRSSSECQGNALYRIITEMLAFYTWDTVHADVRGQHSLDFKGHFIALFRPKNVPDADKQYIFDIQRTAREVHDNARRILYKRQQKMKSQLNNHKHAGTGAAAAAAAGGSSFLRAHNLPTVTHHMLVTAAHQQQQHHHHQQQQQQQQTHANMKELLRTIEDALTCHICCDREIECVFIPCGHQLCCKSCALRCTTCPLCRVPVGECLTAFLPVSREMIDNSKQQFCGGSVVPATAASAGVGVPTLASAAPLNLKVV